MSGHRPDEVDPKGHSEGSASGDLHAYFSIMQTERILLLRPSAPLSKEDFSGLRSSIDAYLSQHAKLHGVMIHAKGFPGWENFGGFIAHMRFVLEHHKQVKRIAVATDSLVAGMAELLGRHFTSAEIRHFPFADDAEALEWLRGTAGKSRVPESTMPTGP